MSTRQATLTAGLVRHALLIATLALVIVFALAQPAFLKPDNVIGIIRQMTLVGIMASAATFVIMTGGVDLSVGPVLALAGLVSFFALEAGLPVPVCVLLGLLSGVAVGAANGLIIAQLELPPIIVTLATLSIVRGTALLVGGPEQHLIRDQPEYSFIGTGSVLGLPVPVLIFAAVVVLMYILQSRTRFGLVVAALGDNERAAFLSGHSVRLTKVSVYALSGLSAALAGIVQSSQVHTALATYGPFGTELDVIAAVVLGGTSIMGGAGSVLRTVLGVIFLGVLNSGMNILNVPVDMQLMAKGAVIVIALGVGALSR